MAAAGKHAMVELNGEFREVSNLPSTLKGAEAAIRESYGFGEGAHLLIQWVDDDGDTITVSSDEEWTEALNAKADLSLTVKASGDLSIVRVEPEKEQQPAGAEAPQDESEDWIVVDPSDAASARNSVASEQAASAASEEARAHEEREKERKHLEALEHRAQLEAEDLKKARELQEEERARAEAERKQAEQDALQAAAEAEAIAASAYNLVHPPKKSAPPAELNIDEATWELVLQLQEMGFGSDHKKLCKVLKDHRNDLTSAIEALAAEAVVGEMPVAV